MQIVINFISKRLPLFILLVGVGTYLSPVYVKTDSWVPSLLLGIVIFFTGISMNISAIKDIRTKKRELFLTTFLKWTITVLISIGVSYLFFSSHPEIMAGMILAGTVPSATAATLYTFLAGGNTSLVIASSLIDIAFSPVITPLAMLGLSGNVVSISFFNLLQSFMVVVVIPLGAGILVQKFFPNSVTYSKSVTKLGSSLTLLLIIHTLVGSGKHAISLEINLIPLMVVATFIQVVLPMIAAYFIAKKLRVHEADARAILFQVGLCNTALAAILAFEFIGELAAIAPIINMIINLSVGAWISNYFAKVPISEDVVDSEMIVNS